VIVLRVKREHQLGRMLGRRFHLAEQEDRGKDGNGHGGSLVADL
jgi:hypothetical protein